MRSNSTNGPQCQRQPTEDTRDQRANAADRPLTSLPDRSVGPAGPGPAGPGPAGPGPAGPVTRTERIASIDVLRGLAVLGILVMNIQSYSMISAAYLNPTSFGDLSGANYAVWLAGHLLANHKFMPIFSMLFGAGIVLMANRREAIGLPTASLHYRRMGLLAVFGILHAHLLWFGDILFHYALCGGVVFLLRRRRPTTLLVTGVLVFAVGLAIALLFDWSMQFWPPRAMDRAMAVWCPDAVHIEQELAVYRGGWTEQMQRRVPAALFDEIFLFATDYVWDAAGLMLIGMALFKLDVFSAKRSAGFYAKMIVAGIAVGLPFVVYEVQRNFAANWSFRACFFRGHMLNAWASVLVALSWIGLVMLVCRHGRLPRLRRGLAAVGRLALTNYLLQTIICTTIFYGHGFGLFGSVSRTGQAGIIAAIWIAQLVLSSIWIRYFRFGPFEWLWRTLTYMKLQPIRLAAVPAASGTPHL